MESWNWDSPHPSCLYHRGEDDQPNLGWGWGSSTLASEGGGSGREGWQGGAVATSVAGSGRRRVDEEEKMKTRMCCGRRNDDPSWARPSNSLLLATWALCSTQGGVYEVPNGPMGRTRWKSYTPLCAMLTARAPQRDLVVGQVHLFKIVQRSPMR
jgi:hypothetical protein